MSEFATLGLSQPLVEAIEELGFIHPTPIQTQAIPQLLNDDTDLVGLAQTGTGKTAAFGLPLVELVDTNKKHTQALVLAPTRELCMQIARELGLFAKHLKRLKVLAVYGGTDIGRQIREVKKGVHILVATPGRLKDLMRRKVVNLSNLEYVVLDEADEMLNMGFKEEIDAILKDTPEDKLTWLFSATMPPGVRRISQNYMTDPLELSAGEQNAANADIEHQYVLVRPSERFQVLKRFLDFDENIFGLIFTRTRRDASSVADQLSKEGYNADALHGDLNQNQRDQVMDRFRTKRLQILVATDVAARGIDVQDITHIFHYNIPDDRAFYTHRSGRTGRAGKKGVSLVLAHPNDLGLLRQLERMAQIRFKMARIPTGREICEKRLLHYMHRIKGMPVNEAIEPYLPAIMEELEGLTKEELVQRIASLSFSRFFKAYRHSPDLNPRKKERTDTNHKRLFINIGKMDVENKSGFLALVCGHCQIPGSAIGKIDMSWKHSFFDVEADSVEAVRKSFRDSNFEGRQIRVNDGATQRRRTKRKR